MHTVMVAVILGYYGYCYTQGHLALACGAGCNVRGQVTEQSPGVLFRGGGCGGHLVVGGLKGVNKSLSKGKGTGAIYVLLPPHPPPFTFTHTRLCRYHSAHPLTDAHYLCSFYVWARLRVYRYPGYTTKVLLLLLFQCICERRECKCIGIYAGFQMHFDSLLPTISHSQEQQR